MNSSTIFLVAATVGGINQLLSLLVLDRKADSNSRTKNEPGYFNRSFLYDSLSKMLSPLDAECDFVQEKFVQFNLYSLDKDLVSFQVN